MIVASAPGKLVLGGEYAVLEGAPAIVAAAQVRATASLGASGSERLPPEVVATRAELERAYGAVPGELTIDVEALRAGDRKLGVGSSAAAAVAAAAVLRAAQGADVASEAELDLIFSAALAGHRAIAPRGSGIDVAASTHGGVLRFEREGSDVRIRRLAFPASLLASVVYTGKEARTSSLLAEVDRLASRDPAAHRAALDRLALGAHAFAAAFESADVGAILEATSAYHEAMNALGRLAGAPIVEASLTTLARLAAEAGGAAKPSGAGGGDVAVAFFSMDSGRVAFEKKCRDQGFMVLELALGGPGVRLRATRDDP